MRIDVTEANTNFRADEGDTLAAQSAMKRGWTVMGGTETYSGLLQALFLPQQLLSTPNTPLDTIAERLSGPLSTTDQVTVFRTDEGETAVLYEGHPGEGFRRLTRELIDIREA